MLERWERCPWLWMGDYRMRRLLAPDGDSEGAVVWILLVAPRNPSSMSTRGFLLEVLGPSRFSSSSNVTFRLCLNLRRSCVLISLLVLAYVRPSCLPSSGRCFCLGWRMVGDWFENKNPSSMSTRGLLPDPEPGLYVNERVPAGGSWTISPFFLVEHCLPLCLNLRLDLVFLSRLYWPPSGHCFYIVQFLAVSSRRHLRHLRVCSHPPTPRKIPTKNPTRLGRGGEEGGTFGTRTCLEGGGG